jgi:hypothetical protein
MKHRSTSRRYGVEIGGVQITPFDLNLIQSNARDILLDEQGFDVGRAWVTATLNYLVSIGVLQATENKTFGETT